MIQKTGARYRYENLAFVQDNIRPKRSAKYTINK